MGFDPQTNDKPLVDGTKRTTKVNIFVVVGVLLFFVVTAIVMFNVMSEPEETRNDLHQENVVTP